LAQLPGAQTIPKRKEQQQKMQEPDVLRTIVLNT
jgi:hypothetical protein